MKAVKYFTPLVVVASLTGLAACGGGGGSDPAAGPTTTGVITSVGTNSVTVKSVDFNTANATVVNDASSPADLRVGMVVSVNGPVNGKSGVAEKIEYDAKVKGFVVSNTLGEPDGNLDVMGMIVKIDDMTVFESKVEGVATPADIQPDMFVEVSGMQMTDATTGDKYVLATRLEVKDKSYSDHDMEIEGVITAIDVDTKTITVAMKNDMMGVDVVYDENTHFEHVTSDTLALDMYVEVEFKKMEVNGVSVNLAYKIEASHADDMDEDGHGEMDNDDDDGNHSMPSMDLFKIQGLVDAVGDNSVTVMGVTVLVNDSTMLHDESSTMMGKMEMGGTMPSFTLADIAVGDALEVKFYSDATSGDFIAKKIERLAMLKMAKVEGLVSDKSDAGMMVAGVSVDVSGCEAADLGMVNVGDQVEVKGMYAEGSLMAKEVETYAMDGKSFSCAGSTPAPL